MLSVVLINNECLIWYEKRQNKICYYEYTLLAKYIVSTKVQRGQMLAVRINHMYNYTPF